MTLPNSLKSNPLLTRWIGFETPGQVRLSPGKVEIGQGILATLARVAAEELGVAPERVRAQPVVTGESPDEGVTAGSLSLQDSGAAIRQAAAEIRDICAEVCAQRHGVPRESLHIEDGAFRAGGATLATYWSLAEALVGAEASGRAAPLPPAARTLSGHPAPRPDLARKLGAPHYLQDLRPAGLLHGRVIRPPSPGATLAALADGPLEGATLHRAGDFLGVTAETEHEAERAAERIARRAQWAERDTLPEDAEAWLRAAPVETVTSLTRGEATPGTRSVTAEFFRPFLAHASIGTCAALALWDGATMDVTAHAQGPYLLRRDLAMVLGLPPERVIIRHHEGAGCYGHNGADDVALDAALLARAHPGRPVRVVWSRAQELSAGPLSPAMLVRVEASLDEAGRIAAWQQEVRGNGHSSRPGRVAVPTLGAAPLLPGGAPFPPSINMPLAAGGGAERNAAPIYAMPALTVLTHRVMEMPIRASALRGLGALAHVWAIESVMDELAALAGEAPLAFRLRHLDDPRAAATLSRAAAMAGWPHGAREEGQGFGLGVARYKGTGAWCAVVAEIRAEAEVRVARLWIAADCGAVINPEAAEAQIEGGAIQAVSIALKEQVRFDRRRILSDSWEAYPILRFPEVPPVEVALMAQPEAPALGAGEASLGPTIAAIANAIHDALGIRPRRMPFTPENLAAA
jgi:CO/xanthine dehydrogenase Mo-binding subunit